MQKELFHPGFAPMFNNKKIASYVENQLKEAIHSIEKYLLRNAMMNFVVVVNHYLKNMYPSYQGELFFIDGMDLVFDKKRFLLVDQNDVLGEKYTEFVEKQKQFIEDAKKYIQKVCSDAKSFEEIIKEHVIPHVDEEFKGNTIFEQFIKKRQFFHYKTQNGEPYCSWSLKLPFDVRREESFFHETTNKPVILDTKKTKGLKVEKIKQLAVDSIYRVKGEISRKLYNEVHQLINKSVNVKIYPELSEKAIPEGCHEVYMFKGNRIVFVPKLLSLSPEQKEEFLNRVKMFGNVTNTLWDIHSKLAKEFDWTEENIDGGYSLESKKISYSITEEQIAALEQEIKAIRDEVLSIENSSEQPKKDIPHLYRYYVKKINEYQLNGNIYEVYRLRGRSKTKVRTFKNGILLSSHQQAKAYRKFKKLNQTS